MAAGAGRRLPGGRPRSFRVNRALGWAMAGCRGLGGRGVGRWTPTMVSLVTPGRRSVGCEAPADCRCTRTNVERSRRPATPDPAWADVAQ
jgi:hypothetical protein